jgi:uncharacterized membrane protein YhfC
MSPYYVSRETLLELILKKMRVFSMLLIGAPILWVIYYLFTHTVVIAPFINGFVMIAAPLGLGAYLAKKYKGSWRIYGIGVLAFITSQALHIPFNSYLLTPILNRYDISASSTGLTLVVLAIALGLSAGLFEEIARFIFYKKWLAEIKNWKQGVMFGAGHGGIEAMVLGAIVIYVFLQAIILKDMSADQLAILVGKDSVEQTTAFLNQYWQTPWYMALLGAVERIIAITFHISAALLVLKSILLNKKIWLWLAIVWHTLLDAVAVYSSITWGALVTEGILAIVGVASLGIMLYMIKILPEVESTGENEAPLPEPITADDLTRIN